MTLSNPGIWDLGSREITAALSDVVLTDGSEGEFITDLDGLVSATLQARFIYGSGGTTCVVVVQTSIDQGASWIDVCRFDFTTANATKVANVSAAAAAAPAAVAALSSEGKLDGILGDRLRAKVTSTGTYGGSTSIAVRAAVR